MIWKRTRTSQRQRQDPSQRAIKQADLEMLELAAAADEIDLLYADESGCCLWSATSYSYYFLGQQKRQEQTKKRGRRLSMMGLWQPFVSFVFSLVLGGFKSSDFIAMMDEQARVAASAFEPSGRIRVIVLDNGPIHTSKAAQAKLSDWQAQGLFLFFLPPYCSEMNPIELEWQHLMRDELLGQMFESEQELACHVVFGLEARGQRNGHAAEYLNLRPSPLSVT